jgi:hypothetical protein
MGLQEIGCKGVEWINVAQNKVQCWGISSLSGRTLTSQGL